MISSYRNFIAENAENAEKKTFLLLLLLTSVTSAFSALKDIVFSALKILIEKAIVDNSRN